MNRQQKSAPRPRTPLERGDDLAAGTVLDA